MKILILLKFELTFTKIVSAIACGVFYAMTKTHVTLYKNGFEKVSR